MISAIGQLARHGKTSPSFTITLSCSSVAATLPVQDPDVALLVLVLVLQLLLLLLNNMSLMSSMTGETNQALAIDSCMFRPDIATTKRLRARQGLACISK